jgi:hypothetical protein
MREKRNGYEVLMGIPQRKRPPGEPRRRLEDSIKINLREVVWGGMVWIYLVQGRNQCRALVNMVMNLRVPRNFEKSLSN